jgi:hypothetical protein
MTGPVVASNGPLGVHGLFFDHWPVASVALGYRGTMLKNGDGVADPVRQELIARQGRSSPGFVPPELSVKPTSLVSGWAQVVQL